MRTYPVPRNVEDALQRKRKVADEISFLQTRIKDRAPIDESGRVLRDSKERAAYRERMKHSLEALYGETRFLKDWLRQHATHKPSEYEMLGRAYRVLSAMEEKGIPIGEEGEVLLHDIELYVPHAYLMADELKTA